MRCGLSVAVPDFPAPVQPFVFPLAFSRPSENRLSVGSASSAKAALFKLGVSSASDIRAAALAEEQAVEKISRETAVRPKPTLGCVAKHGRYGVVSGHPSFDAL